MAKKTQLTPKTSSKNMDELLGKLGYKLQVLSRGQKVEGKVIEIGSGNLILDIGTKSEGLISDREFEIAKSFIETVSVGDKVNAVVLNPETSTGYVSLSVADASFAYGWDKLSSCFINNEPIEVKIQGVAKGGLTVETHGILGFVPASHMGFSLSENPQAMIGKNIKVKIIELDRIKNRLVLSEKAVSESGLIEKQEKTLKTIKKGEVLKGKVIRVVNFGIFVEIEKNGVSLEGLVHLSEISWSKIENPGSEYSEGDEVEVVVIGREEGRLAFSIKQTLEDPWGKIEEKYKTDMQLSGTVVKTGSFGAFVEIEPGIEGLVRLAKIPSDQSLKADDKVNVLIEEVDSKKHKISLGLVLKAKPVGYK